jgi:dihydrofolate reductase
MNQSLDGYVDYQQFGPDAVLFRHWIDHVSGLAGSIYGRRMYEIMRYWDDDDSAWDDERRAFADAWRNLPKWVVSNTLTSVGPNATLINGNPETAVRDLKTLLVGEISVSGPTFAKSMTEHGLIDEYRLYLHPVVLGGGEPFFAEQRPPLCLVASERIGSDVIMLTYAPA